MLNSSHGSREKTKQNMKYNNKKNLQYGQNDMKGGGGRDCSLQRDVGARGMTSISLQNQ